MTSSRSLMSRVLILIWAVTSFLAVGVSARADEVATFEGSGWGHGIGMSQYGARGMAEEGYSFDGILTHFYHGSQIDSLGNVIGATHDLVAGDAPLRVGLLQKVTLVEFKAIDGRIDLCQSGDGEGDCPKGAQPAAGELWSFSVVAPGQCQFFRNGEAQGSPGECNASIRWGDHAYELPEVLDESGNPIPHPVPATLVAVPTVPKQFAHGASDPTYAHGILRIRPFDSSTFHVGLDLTVDEYVRGIAEVPAYWPQQALMAQAVAARSYAAYKALVWGPVANLPAARPACGCHVYATTFDQVYIGWNHEKVAPEWITAADGTAGLVVRHQAAAYGVVSTFYSSSSGGVTENNSEIWGGTQLPYLVSVIDPWSADPGNNPFANWSVDVSKATMESKVGIHALTRVEVTAINTSGSAKTVTFTGYDDNHEPITKAKTAGWVRSNFGLRSQYYSVFATFNPPPDVPPPAPPPPTPESVGLHDPTTGVWYLKNADGTVKNFYYGNPADMPYAGDWNGSGQTTPGLYRVSTGFLFLRNTNTQGIADIQIYYGDPGDLPVAGDWNGDGLQTVGIFRPADARFYLRNVNTQGVADIVVEFGEAGDQVLAGDWDGDGIDTVGVYRASTQMLYLTNSHSGGLDFTWKYSGTLPGDKVIAGDWNGDGVDTVGVFRPATSTFYLRDTFTQPSANIVHTFGESHMSPVAGSWG